MVLPFAVKQEQTLIAQKVTAKYGYWSYAARAFQAAIELEPTYAEAHAFLGLSLDEMGKNGFDAYQRAIELAER